MHHSSNFFHQNREWHLATQYMHSFVCETILLLFTCVNKLILANTTMFKPGSNYLSSLGFSLNLTLLLHKLNLNKF